MGQLKIMQNQLRLFTFQRMHFLFVFLTSLICSIRGILNENTVRGSLPLQKEKLEMDEHSNLN